MRILDELALNGERLHRIGGKDLCHLLGLSSGALADLKKRGIAVHLGHDAYDLEATVRAYVTHLRGVAAGWGSEEQAINLTAERARLAKEQADAQALKNAAPRGELVPAADVERAWGDVLRQVWAVPVSGAKQVARQRTGPDFRPLKRLVLGEAPQPELVPEAAEYPWGTIDEAQEAYQIETFGKIYGWSRQMEVNDDIGFAAGVGPRFVQAARAFEATKLAKLIDDNPTMSDDVTVFDASDHKNAKAATSTGEGVTLIDAILADLEAARLGQRKQTGLSGGLIDVTPRAVLVPPALETPMERALSQVQATSVSETNPFAQLRLVVEPRLASETKWYVIDTELDGLEYAYLEGAPGPQIEIECEFDRDVSKIKLRLDFGAGWIDHRSWFRVG